MDLLHKTYRKLNPFVNSSVGEREIWGEESANFCDVESIHGEAFREILDDIEQVSEDHLTRGRFLVGAAGTGKSHLFARLRRKLSHGQFTFVSNPPADHWAIKRYILKKVISGMKRPVLMESGPLRYSQLQRIVYVLLRNIRRYPGLPINKIYEAWASVRREEYYPGEEELFVNALQDLPNIDIPLHVCRVLFRVLDDEKRGLATAWLSGNQCLTDMDYERLGVSGPIEDHELADVFKWFGLLSIDAGPIVLVLDQLDGLGNPAQIGEIESLLIDLKDAGRNWYVIVSLLHPRFDLWNSILSDPFKGKFGESDRVRIQLKVSQISALTAEQARELLSVRLLSPELQAQRKRDGTSDPYYPLTREMVEGLAKSSDSATSARALLQRASDEYVEVLSGTRPPTKQLADFLESTLIDIRTQLSDVDLDVDTSFVADRIKELFNLMSLAYTGLELESGTGPLHKDMGSFRGSDRIYLCNDKAIRVVGHDVQQGKSFPSVLERIVNAPSSTILIRDGRIRCSGAVTTKLLTQYQQDKAFCHLSLDELKSLHALGAILARMREGDFNQEETEPVPTGDNILKCLADHKDLMDTNLAREFKRIAALEETTGPIKKEPEPPPPVPPGSVIQVITEIMEGERWLAFERLCARIMSRSTGTSRPEIYDCLRVPPVREKATIYPIDSSPLEAPAIVVWIAEA